MIRAENLSIGYMRGKDKYLVQRDLQLEVHPGELVALIGTNGCGKSTLLRTLSALQAPLAGKIFVQGVELNQLSLSEQSRLFSVVLTQNVKIEYCTVYQMVALGRSPYTGRWGNLDDCDKMMIEEALDRVNMRSFANKQLSDLSDGERQRVMIAKALAQNTPLIFLDEPSSHLDLPNRIALNYLLESLAKDLNKCILFSTHELELALHHAHKIWLMKPHAGGLVADTPAVLLQQGLIQEAFTNEHFSIDSEGTVRYL